MHRVVDQRPVAQEPAQVDDLQAQRVELLGLRVGFERERWEVFGEVRNLLDREYVGVFSVLDRASAGSAILQAGEPRSVYAGLRLRF